MSGPRSGQPLPEAIQRRLRLPLIAAPMLRVSGPELVIAACRSGVVGAFPTANARTVEELDQWLTEIEGALKENATPAAPYCPNLIIRQPRFKDDLACLVRHRVEMVITSVGSPAAAVGPLHDVGAQVFADIASLRHAEKAGCDLAYMGTRFIATTESRAVARYKDMLVASNLDDVMLTKAFTGLDASMLRPSIEAAGLDPDKLDEQVSEERAKQHYGGGSGKPAERPKRWADIWSAGHSVSGVQDVVDASVLVARLAKEYEAARARS